jgi:hypothetical protein
MDRDTKAASRVACTVRERCIFETGIKLATIYHQYVGTPFNGGSIDSLEEAIANSIMVQPYVSYADVTIDRSVLPPLEDHYSYVSLGGNMIDAVVEVTIDGVTVRSEMRYDEELGYPLMYVSEIRE